MTLERFIKGFIPPSTFIRLWIRNEDQNLICIKSNEGDGSVFDWEVLEGKVLQSKYLKRYVFGLPTICLNNQEHHAIDIEIF